LCTAVALVSRDTPPLCASRAEEPDEVGRVGVRRQLLLVAVGPRERVLAAEILDMAEPVSEHALRQPVPEMRADPPEDHAEIVFRVRLDRQPADDDKTAPLLDLTADLVDDRAQRRQLEMLAPEIVEAETGRLDAGHRVLKVAQLARHQLDRVIRRRGEIGRPPGAGMIDRQPVDRCDRAIVGFARLSDRRHRDPSSLAQRRRQSVGREPSVGNHRTDRSASTLAGGYEPLATRSERPAARRTKSRGRCPA
jgi:hypothetical protein